MITQQTQTSTLMTHGICKLRQLIQWLLFDSYFTIWQLLYKNCHFHFENQFNSYCSTAILQFGSHFTKTATPTSKPSFPILHNPLNFSVQALHALIFKVFHRHLTSASPLRQLCELSNSTATVTLMGENRSIGAGAQRRHLWRWNAVEVHTLACFWDASLDGAHTG
ncbi:hypothetical protein E4U39_003496 [Claviceps sp. Clav50 group G5]|nr:hypothetical protein E4U39_003496 [Claviceps sp. Clav50 group G5]